MQKWVNTYRDILHIYFSPYYKNLPAREFEKVAPRRPGKKVKVVLRTFCGRVGQFLKREVAFRYQDELVEKVWLFAMSKNNLDALRFIHATIPDSVFVLDKQRPEFSACRTAVPSLRYQALYAVLYVFLLPALMFKESRYAFSISTIIFRSLGFYEEWLRVLRKWRPKAIVFANDHNLEARALLLAARQLKIPTIYIQHASVSLSFPPLKFDLSLLEGRDTYDKYKAIGGINGRVEFVGMPKFDNYLKFRKKRDVINRIGIPYNLNDDVKVLELLIVALKDAFPDKIITIRKHPKDKSKGGLIAIQNLVNESNPTQESALDFLRAQDCIIAGNSSIHLEATLLNIPSVYFQLGADSLVYDYYGYVRNGLISSVSNFEDVIDFIRSWSGETVYRKASYYNSVVGDCEEGNSQQLAIDHIVDFLNRA